jgi:integrase
MKKKLTALAIPTLPEGDYPDAYCPGLLLRVGANRRTWVFRYRQGGKRHRDRLGYFPAMGLAEAREAAGELGKRIEAGLPAQPVAANVVHPQSPNALTIGRMIDKYEAMRVKEGVRIKSLPLAMRTIRNGLADHLSTPTEQFSKADLKAVRQKIFNRAPIQANRFMAYLGPVMTWGVQELDAFEHNFHGDIRKGKERKRSRVLTDAELAAVWRATFAMETAADDGNAISRSKSNAARSYARLVRFLILTAQRLDEAASLRCRDIIDGQWRFTTKGDKPYRLKLPQLALDQIGAGEARALCFPGQRDNKITGWSILKDKLDDISGVTGWRLHDLRRTSGSRMEEIGHDAALVHFILNHSRRGLSAVYLHSDLFERMATALADWADELERIVGSHLR